MSVVDYFGNFPMDPLSSPPTMYKKTYNELY